MFYVHASVGPSYTDDGWRRRRLWDFIVDKHSFIVFLYVFMEVCIGSLNKYILLYAYERPRRDSITDIRTRAESLVGLNQASSDPLSPTVTVRGNHRVGVNYFAITTVSAFKQSRNHWRSAHAPQYMFVLFSATHLFIAI